MAGQWTKPLPIRPPQPGQEPPVCDCGYTVPLLSQFCPQCERPITWTVTEWEWK